MPGKYKIPPLGNLPQRGRIIWERVYTQTRDRYPNYSKEVCSRIAWTAVENAGFIEVRKVWIDTRSPAYRRQIRMESKEHPRFARKAIGTIVQDHMVKRKTGTRRRKK